MSRVQPLVLSVLSKCTQVQKQYRKCTKQCTVCRRANIQCNVLRAVRRVSYGIRISHTVYTGINVIRVSPRYSIPIFRANGKSGYLV